MRIRLSILYVFILLSHNIVAQDADYESDVVFNSEVYGSLIFHTNGWGAGIHKTWLVSEEKKWILSGELVTIKHPKEEKRLNPYIDNTKRYVYGKMNYFSTFRPTVGRESIIFNKGAKRGVQVSSSFALGGSIGFARPVYLEVLYPSILGRDEGATPSSEIYNPAVHNPDMIVGRDSYFRGFDKTQVFPGFTGKVGLVFDYAGSNNLVREIEVGLILDAYFKRIPLMAFSHNQRMFLTGNLCFHFGKKQ